ncbi:MAG: leucine-rich repeat domain-containing protein [Lachnospiraceae bacterium]|nr:leucine-rich repeat domain-containing protein [Lachnospiraceae bacterium]
MEKGLKKAKRLKSIITLLAFVLTITFASISVKAEKLTGYCGAEEGGKNIQWTFENGVMTLTGEGEMMDGDISWELPDEYWSLSDKDIVRDDIKEVIVGEGISSLGDGAFYRCEQLTSASLPSSLTSIGVNAFAACSELKAIVIPQGVVSIGDSGFKWCSSLGEISIPASVKSIGEDAFCACTNVSKIDISQGVESIGIRAFGGCEKVEKVVYPSGVGDIKENMFCDCTGLKEIEIPDDVKVIGGWAFSGCTKLQSIVIPASVKEIGTAAFGGCVKLENVTILGEVESIGEGVFSNCKKLQEINLSKVNKVGYRAFENCENLEKVILSEKISKIEGNVFFNCGSLKDMVIPNSVTSIDGGAFAGCANYKCVFPDNLKHIGKGAFGTCSLMRDVIIPDTVTSIEMDAFEADRIVLPKGFTDLPEKLFESDNTTTIIYCKNNDQIDCCKENGYLYIDGTQDLSIENCEVELKSEKIQHTGNPMETEVTVSYTQGENVISLKEGFDYELEYSDNIKVGTGKIKVKGINVWGGEKDSSFEIYADINSTDIKLDAERFLYDGTEKKPAVTITYDGDTLEENKDYKIQYVDNVNEGEASVVITGEGFYKESVSKSFTIYKNALEEKDVSLEYTEILYDGKAKTPKVTVKHAGNELKEGTDYILSFDKNTEVGNAVAVIEGKGSYKGTVSKTFNIYKYDITKAEVNLSYSEIMCDGTEKVTAVTVKYSGKELVKDKDYTVTVKDNILPGNATVVVEGAGQYAGTVNKTFELKGISLDTADVSIKESIYSYDGSPKTPVVEVKINDKVLIQDTDYSVSYENNVDDGTAHAVVTGMGIYIDTVKVSFVILPYNAGMDAVYPDGTLIDGNFVYGVMDDETNEVEVFCPASKSVSKLQIPATITDENGVEYKVTSIGNKAFYKNTKLTSVVIGNNVKSIEDYAFYGCKNIKTLKLGSGIEIIGNSSFRKCTKLTTVTLPKSIDSLGKNAFYGCSKLKTITINANSVIDVKANAIKGISKKAVIKVPKKLVKKYKKEFDKKSGFKGGMKIKKK